MYPIQPYSPATQSVYSQSTSPGVQPGLQPPANNNTLPVPGPTQQNTYYQTPGVGIGPEQVPPGGPVQNFNSPLLQPMEPSVPLGPIVYDTQTGKLMVGVGVNSDAGLVGNIVVDEQNFDIMRWPNSWDDFVNGTAFRGAGERLRLEAAPGTEVSRYVISYGNPYLFDSPINFTTSVSYFTRIYDNWDETRVGGRIGLGYYFTPDLVGTVGMRIENVKVNNPTVPTPPQVEDVLGWNFLFGPSIGFAHDTRDSPFLAGQGHLLKVNFEEVFGKFQYPIETLEARQYYTVAQRPDGSGRQILGIGGLVGFCGGNTPVYDDFYAGGFSTLRGWAFRGASPLVDNVAVGGDFEMLGTVEYNFPITADDFLRAVVFTDFGTVEPTTEIKGSDFRIAPGFGLRIAIPALGPAPIALDFAFPIHKMDGDTTQVFSFFVGLNR